MNLDKIKKVLLGESIDSNYSEYSSSDNGVIGGIAGTVIGGTGGAIVVSKLNKSGKALYVKLNKDLVKSHSKRQKDLCVDIEDLSEFLSNNETNYTSSTLMNVASGIITNIAYKKEKLKLHKAINEYNRSLTPKQHEIINKLSKVSSVNGLKLLGGLIGGAVIGGIAGYKLGERY